MRCLLTATALLGGLLIAGSAVRAESPGPDAKDVQAVVDKAVAFLRSSQGQDGSFSPGLAGPGVSAVVAAALVRSGIGTNDPMVAKTFNYLESSVRKDGGVYSRGLANYTTSVAVMAFAEANKDGKYDAIIKNAVHFLRSMQFDDSKVESGDAPYYGGSSYDGKTRPDLSNTQYFLDALQAAGVGKDDPAVKRALVFVSRCQNLPGEHNDLAFAKKASPEDRGGLVYNPFEQQGRGGRHNPLDPTNRGDETPSGGLRSAGAMTYAGLKSFLYAGLSKDDPRVQGAIRWIRGHYTLNSNPGMGPAGLFYYYETFAKALTALGENTFEDAKGVKHDWRKDLFEALQKRQRADGSFVNEGSRQFGEGDPNLATAFALLALSYTRPAAK